MNIDPISFAIVVAIIAIVTVARYRIIRKQRKTLSKEDESIHEFISNFRFLSLNNFSLFNFKVGQESSVSPFPSKKDEEWIYTIFLSSVEVENFTTITHEISECTIGRLIEKILNLEKPLYLKRKEEDKFWVHGKNQKYLLEHMVTALSEIGQVDSEALKERFSKEDFEELIK